MTAVINGGCETSRRTDIFISSGLKSEIVQFIQMNNMFLLNFLSNHALEKTFELL